MKPDVLPGCRCDNERHRRRFHDGGEPPIAIARDGEPPRTGCIERDEDTSLEPRPDEMTTRRSRCH